MDTDATRNKEVSLCWTESGHEETLQAGGRQARTRKQRKLPLLEPEVEGATVITQWQGRCAHAPQGCSRRKLLLTGMRVMRNGDNLLVLWYIVNRYGYYHWRKV